MTKNMLKATAFSIATALLLSPAVGAWSSFGAYEPDTILDTPEWMWQEPGPASGNRIYFNAWTKVYFVGNPNVGSLESANEVPTLEGHEAILGVWVDCNGDGYVGHAESALADYRSELLLDDSICPPTTGSAANWVKGAHNYNGWVTELIPIAGPHDDGTGAGNDTRVYRDPDARVWGDTGLPDQSSEESGGGSCPIEPLPRGTWASTGGLINYADCGTGVLEAWNRLWSTPAGDPLALAVADDDDARGSALDVTLFGDDSTDHAAVSVIDCDGEPTLDTAAEMNSTGLAAAAEDAFVAIEGASGLTIEEGYQYWGFTVPALDPDTENTNDPTIPGQVNQTFEENDDCDTSNDDGHDFYELLLEGDNVANPVVGKHQAEQNFVYSEATRGGLPFVVPAGSSGTAGASPFYGVQTGIRNVFVTTGWASFNVLIKYGPQTIVTRGGLSVDDPPSVDIAGGQHFTYYAYVGSASTTTNSLKTPGGQGTYGSAQCGDNGSGIHNGWDCDASHWNLNANGEPIDGQELLAFPGDAYNLRDIDCYDGSTNLGVGAGLAYYGNEPCVRPVS